MTSPSTGVALVELDRPHRRNALDRLMLDSLPGIVRALDADPSVRAIVLSGRGGAFCAGGDLDVIGALGDETPAEARQRMKREFSATTSLAEATTFTVAAVDGPAVGAGMALALACELRVGGPTASMASPFIRMGLVPDFGVSWLLARSVGQGPAIELAVTGRKVLAEEAVRIGLLHRVTDRPLADAVECAAQVAAAAPLAAAATTRLVREASHLSLEEIIDREINEQIAALGRAEFAERMAQWSATVRGQASATGDRRQ